MEELARWKTTEYRTFVLYVGPIMLKNVVSDICYNHFMSLNIVMIILLSPDFGSLIDYAQELLEYFVKTFENIYGQYLMSYNIHELLYLVEDYKKYGPLDSCSTFPFENYMKVLKSMTRKPIEQLEQIILRYNETKLLKSTENTDRLLLLGLHNKGPLIENTTNPQFRTLIWGNYKLKSHVISDSYFCTFQNEYIQLLNIAHSKNTSNIILLVENLRNKWICILHQLIHQT